MGKLGITGPAVTGFMIRDTGLFTNAFLLTGAVALAGAFFVAVFARRPNLKMSAA